MAAAQGMAALVKDKFHQFDFFFFFLPNPCRQGRMVEFNILAKDVFCLGKRQFEAIINMTAHNKYKISISGEFFHHCSFRFVL